MMPTEPKTAAVNYKWPSATWLSRSCVTQAPVLDFIQRAKSSFRDDDYFLNQSLSILGDLKDQIRAFQAAALLLMDAGVGPAS